MRKNATVKGLQTKKGGATHDLSDNSGDEEIKEDPNNSLISTNSKHQNVVLSSKSMQGRVLVPEEEKPKACKCHYS